MQSWARSCGRNTPTCSRPPTARKRGRGKGRSRDDWALLWWGARCYRLAESGHKDPRSDALKDVAQLIDGDLESVLRRLRRAGSAHDVSPTIHKTVIFFMEQMQRLETYREEGWMPGKPLIDDLAAKYEKMAERNLSPDTQASAEAAASRRWLLEWDEREKIAGGKPLDFSHSAITDWFRLRHSLPLTKARPLPPSGLFSEKDARPTDYSHLPRELRLMALGLPDGQ
jgi:hypothetical protein